METSPTHAEPGQDERRRLVAELAAIERPSASEGEREAAEWIVAASTSWAPRRGSRPSPPTAPTGGRSGSAPPPERRAGLAGFAAAGFLAAALGTAAAAALAEYPPGKRRLRAPRLPQSFTHNVVRELGPRTPSGPWSWSPTTTPRTRGGSSPRDPRDDLPSGEGADRALDTSPALMWPLLASPLLAVASALTGSRFAARLAALLGFGYASMAQIGSREVVPGANDNATAVVLLLELARRCSPSDRVDPRDPALDRRGVLPWRMAFGERHFDELPRDRTFFLCVDTVGSPTLNVLRGEGLPAHARVHARGARAARRPRRRAQDRDRAPAAAKRHRRARAALRRLPTATLCSVTELKQPANYHWPTDTAENVDYGTLADAIRLTEAAVRRLDERWL